MTGQVAFEAVTNVRDELITEAGERLGLLAVGAGAVATGAAGASQTAFELYSLPTTEPAVKAGFGAWLAKGGWIALTAGVLVAAGVAVGAFLLGKSGDTPPVGSGEVTTEDTEQSISEDTNKEETNESEAETADLSYFQFPLTSADDTTSYVSITDPDGDGRKTVELFVLPTDGNNSELKSVIKFIPPQYGEANIQIVSYKTETNYGFIYVYEEVITDDPVLYQEGIHVMMEGYRLRFSSSGNYYFNPEYGTRTCHFQGNDEKTVSVVRYTYNQNLLKRAEGLLADYSDLDQCEFTVLYRYVDGEETINTPVETMPDFPFTIFHTYNQPDLEG